MKKKSAVAVIGGTFNPTTIAHINLGIVATQVLNADKVIYVPSKTDFLKEWKQMNSQDIMSDETRVQLLQESIAAQLGLNAEVEDCEITGKTSGKTYDTLTFIQKKYDAENVYWVMGSDKLCELNRWYRWEELMEQYHFLVIQRDGDDVADMIESSCWLSRYQNRIRIVPAEQKMQTISATRVRNAMKSGAIDQIRELVPHVVYRYLEQMISGQIE